MDTHVFSLNDISIKFPTHEKVSNAIPRRQDPIPRRVLRPTEQVTSSLIVCLRSGCQHGSDPTEDPVSVAEFGGQGTQNHTDPWGEIVRKVCSSRFGKPGQPKYRRRSQIGWRKRLLSAYFPFDSAFRISSSRRNYFTGVLQSAQADLSCIFAW